MSKFRLSVLYFTGAMLLLSGFTQRHALACEFIEYSNYLEISPNIFAHASFTSDQKEKLLATINLAKFRVNNTFGSMASAPKVVVASNDEEAANFGSNAYGTALLTPLGQCIVFGPKGQNIDVIAHEYVHAEVHFRMGWLHHLLNIPTWFNEGIALLVDFRKPYLLENINLTLKDIESVRVSRFDFSISSYQASRVLVEDIDKTKLYQGLEKIKQGQDIHSVFAL